MNSKTLGLKTTSWVLGCAMGLFVSCASDDGPVEIIGNVPEAARGELVRLNTSSPLITTRGGGAVGNIVNSELNVWNSNELHLYAIAKGADNLSYDYQDVDQYVPTLLLGGKKDNYMGQIGLAPDGVANGGIRLVNNKEDQLPVVCYYPIVGAYHFMGFHIEDAVASAHLEEDDAAIYVDVKYNGTQDIMTTQQDLFDYTTRTAREGIVPELKFEHQLTRLVFYVVAGDEHAVAREFDFEDLSEEDQKKVEDAKAEDPDYVFESMQGVLMENVCLKNQKNTGYMRLSSEGVTWHFNDGEEDSQADFNLNEEDGYEVKGGVWNEETDKPKPVKVGDMLVNPELDYISDISVVEFIDQDGLLLVDKNLKEKVYKSIRIATDNGDPFEAGKSYDVKITVFAAEKIVVNASLSGWENGGEINITPDD